MVTYLNWMGGHSPCLNHVLWKIVSWVRVNDMSYSAVHLAGTVNGQANHLSCLFPQHKWKTSQEVFNHVERQWGPHTIDRFTMVHNALLPCFNSHFLKPGSEGVDVLLQDWTGENNWAAPPITLIPKILCLVKDQGATASIVAPVWKGCCWWADLNALSIADPVLIANDETSFIGDFTIQPEPLHLDMALDDFPDLWATRTNSLSPCTISQLTTALAPNTWHHILAAIVALYELLDLHPTKDPLIMHLQKGLIHSHTHQPIKKSKTFDLSALQDLFHEWGSHSTKQQLRAKLLALLCLVGAF